MQSEELLQIDNKGRIVLPRNARKQGQKYYACQTESDGTVHLVPVVGVLTAKQAYFWSKKWQRGEREASEDLEKGRFKVVAPKKLASYLKNL